MRRLLEVSSLFFVVMALVAFAGPISPSQEQISKPSLREELLRMADEDQNVRSRIPLDIARASEVDKKNTARLKEIIGSIGWPYASLVGTDGEHAAWLLTQHADQDTTFQRNVLKLLEDAVRVKKTQGSYYAYLYDRLHQPQRYGTQGKCVAEGRWEPREIEDPANVDKRRTEFRMPPLAQYRETASLHGCKGIITELPGWRAPGT